MRNNIIVCLITIDLYHENIEIKALNIQPQIKYLNIIENWLCQGFDRIFDFEFPYLFSMSFFDLHYLPVIETLIYVDVCKHVRLIGCKKITFLQFVVHQR